MTGKSEVAENKPIEPYIDHFALEGVMPNGKATVLRCQHHLPEDEKASANDMSDQTLNLGGITIWPCNSCVARIRNGVLTDVLVDSGKILLRNDPEFVQELIKRMKDEREQKDGQ